MCVYKASPRQDETGVKYICVQQEQQTCSLNVIVYYLYAYGVRQYMRPLPIYCSHVAKRDGTVLIARTASSDGTLKSSFHELSGGLNMYPVLWMVHIHEQSIS